METEKDEELIEEAKVEEPSEGPEIKTSQAPENLTFPIVLLFVLNTAYFVTGQHAAPEMSGLALRSWYSGIALCFIVLWQILVIALAVSVISRRGSKPGNKVLTAGILATGAVIVCALAVLFIGTAYGIDEEKRNENGSITVMHDTNILDPDARDYSLWKPEGLITRRFVRAAVSADDTDPAISMEDYLGKLKAEERKASAEADADTYREEIYSSDAYQEYEEVPEAGTGDGEPPAGEVISEDTQAYDDRITDGMVAIYAEFFAPLGIYKYETDWSAKGEPGAVFYDDDETVCFLRYDRMSKNGKCLLYVYYEADKDDPSVTSGDTHILDMYAYVTDTGEVIDSGRKAWADTGTDEYREATGE